MPEKQQKIEALLKHPEEIENRGRVSIPSLWPLSTKERNALKRRAQLQTERSFTKEYLAELEHALKSLSFSEDTVSEKRQITVSNVLRTRPFNSLSDMEHKTVGTLQEDKNVISLSTDKK